MRLALAQIAPVFLDRERRRPTRGLRRSVRPRLRDLDRAHRRRALRFTPAEGAARSLPGASRRLRARPRARACRSTGGPHRGLARDHRAREQAGGPGETPSPEQRPASGGWVTAAGTAFTARAPGSTRMASSSRCTGNSCPLTRSASPGLSATALASSCGRWARSRPDASFAGRTGCHSLARRSRRGRGPAHRALAGQRASHGRDHALRRPRGPQLRRQRKRAPAGRPTCRPGCLSESASSRARTRSTRTAARAWPDRMGAGSSSR